jgi:hypothetical protein
MEDAEVFFTKYFYDSNTEYEGISLQGNSEFWGNESDFDGSAQSDRLFPEFLQQFF